MSGSRTRRAALAALTLSFLALACRDDVLGPPDSAQCTAGTVRGGAAVDGRVSDRSCLVWNDYEYEVSPAESWTLPVEAGMAYIVRLEPIANEADENTFRGTLNAYARSEDGDAVFAAGYHNSYGPTNTRGGRARQMILTPAHSGRVSLRVQAYSLADTGAYTLSVLTCPVIDVAVGETSDAVALEDDCALRVGAASDSNRVAFFGFAAEALDQLEVTATRTAGTANSVLRVGGPGLDFSCYTGVCTNAGSGVGAGPHVLLPYFAVDGRFTAMLTQESAGTVSATLRVAPSAMLTSSTGTSR